MKNLEIYITVKQGKIKKCYFYYITLFLKDCKLVGNSSAVCKNNMNKNTIPDKLIKDSEHDTVLKILLKDVKCSFSKYKGRNLIRNLFLGKDIGENQLIILYFSSVLNKYSDSYWTQCKTNLFKYDLEIDESEFVDNFWLMKFI